jgi:hypothetical protein
VAAAAASTVVSPSGEPAEDRLSAFGRVLTAKVSDERNRAFLNLVAGMHSRDAQKVFAMLLNLAHSGQNVRSERSLLARRWGALDPLAALGFLDGVAVKDRSKQDYENLLDGWASTDPRAARDWVSANRDHPQFDQVLLGFVAGYASQDLTGATSDVLSTLAPTDKLAAQALWRLAQAANNASPATLTAWFDQLPATSPDALEFKRLAADDVVRLMPPDQFEANAQWVSAMASAPWRNDPTIAAFARSYAGSDPETAMDWVQNMPGRPKDGIIIGVGEIVNSWAHTDLDGLQNWLTANPTSPAYQQAVRDLALNLNGKDQSLAEYYANQIASPTTKAQILNTLSKPK